MATNMLKTRTHNTMNQLQLKSDQILHNEKLKVLILKTKTVPIIQQ